MPERARKYAAVVFGASGFTGKHVAIELGRSFEAEGERRAWAVAGRSEKKLEKVVAAVNKAVECRQSIDMIVADITDQASIDNMCEECDVVLDCVGPFRFYGESVVRACIKSECHYVDISGEPEYLEKMQMKYHDEAVATGVSIVGSCGFDSIPCDVGLQHLKENFPGTMTAAESYVSFNGRMKVHYGTYETLVHSFANKASLSSVRKAIMPKKIQYEGKPLPKRGHLFHSKDENKWCVPFAGADASVVRRSQYSFSEDGGDTPVRYSPYIALASMYQVVGLVLFGIFLFVLTKFEFGTKLLLQHPKIFSFGAFSHEGPTKEDIATTTSTMSFHGHGHSGDKSGSKPVSKRMTMYFREPGYNATSTFVVQSALTLLYDEPRRSGVLTPAVAFRGTNLVKRLKGRGVKFAFS